MRKKRIRSQKPKPESWFGGLLAPDNVVYVFADRGRKAMARTLRLVKKAKKPTCAEKHLKRILGPSAPKSRNEDVVFKIVVQKPSQCIELVTVS